MVPGPIYSIISATIPNSLFEKMNGDLTSNMLPVITNCFPNWEKFGSNNWVWFLYNAFLQGLHAFSFLTSLFVLSSYTQFQFTLQDQFSQLLGATPHHFSQTP